MLPALTIFLGAFLVFLVQPLVGNTLLPVFGGTAAVWSLCLASFQTLLVGGYFYAHVVGWKGGRLFLVHIGALFLAAGGLLAVVTDGAAGVRALSMRLAAVAVAYVVLSANSSLVQLLAGGKYKLYAVSNFGSLMGLLAYPFLFEYFLPLSTQWVVFAALGLAYAALFAVLVAARPESAPCRGEPLAQATEARHQAPGATYFALSFVSCYLLNAVSTHLCADVTPLPMMWCLLLALYLMSYIVAFTDRGAAWARYAGLAVVPLCLFAVYHLGKKGYLEYPVELAIGCALLLFGGWVVHARLYRLRPGAAGLTRYYCLIALGGAAGGAMCSFVMPFVSTIVAEYPISLTMVLGVVYFDWEAVILRIARMCVTRPESAPDQASAGVSLTLSRRCAAGGLAVVAVYGLINGAASAEGFVLKRFRNFYGTGAVAHVAVKDIFGNTAFEVNQFLCNNTMHGQQVVHGDWKGMEPLAYYAPHAGGAAIELHPKRAAKKPVRVSLLGMGIGTMAAYAKEGDFFRFYEINPAVADIARDQRYFGFVGKADGTVDIVVDDARKGLDAERREGAEKYDVIVVDVFSGDSIPSHMVTKEAFELYLDRLEEDGILALHLTNWHLNLQPMVKASAQGLGLKAKIFKCGAVGRSSSSIWAFLSRREIPIGAERGVRQEVPLAEVKDVRFMTDDCHSLLPYLSPAFGHEG